MAILMFDSVNPATIPSYAEIVAGYVDGAISKWPDAAWAWFPAARKIRITVTGLLDADVADVERFDLTPAQGALWVSQRPRTWLERPVLYCNRDTRPELERMCAVVGLLPGRDFDLWIATLDGTQDVPGAVAVQFEDAGPYDISTTAEGWPPGGDEMPKLYQGTDDGAPGGSGAVWISGDLVTKRLVPTAGQVDVLKQTLGAPVPLQQEILDAVKDVEKLVSNPAPAHTHPVSLSGTTSSPSA